MSHPYPTEQDLQQKLKTLESRLRRVYEEKRELEAEVLFEREKTRGLLDGLTQVGVGISIVDENNRILFQNEVMQVIFGEGTRGFCREQTRGQSDYCDVCPFMKALEEETVVKHLIRARNGHNYQIITAPLPPEEGYKARAFGIFFDVFFFGQTDNQRQELEARLQRAEKLESIGVLAGGVAHDLNNIMAALVGYPDILLNELPADSPLSEPIRAMKESGEQAAAVVQDLLTLSRQGFKHTMVLNLNDIVSSYFNSLQYNRLAARHRNVAVQTHLEPGLGNIIGSALHLTKTLMNLVVNAMDAMPDGGSVLVSTLNRELSRHLVGYEDIPSGNYVVLRIEDSGSGINPGDWERIFEPFYTRKSVHKSGTGLGLAVVWGTVKDHQGFLDLHSASGKGTVFELYFPRTEKEMAINQQQVSLKDLSGSGEKILVIDDIPEQRDIAAKILSRLGYFVVTVSNGQEGIEYLRKYPMDLAIIDMIMEPGFDGLDTYIEILKSNPNQKALIISGYSETDRVKQAHALGAVHYIRKPYNMETLGVAVKKELLRE